ncbi:MAG TPA: thioredoxin family protein [Acidimicrobiales bacterium]|nr:thioredoxin family protein [Acidimicrobiales bacterium]
MAAVAEATKDNFQDLIAEGTVLVDVWGPQCVPCVALAPHVDQLAEERPDISVIKLEAPKARRVCIDLKVMTMPTFLLFRDGEEVARISDANLSPDKLHEWLDETLAAPKEVS